MRAGNSSSKAARKYSWIILLFGMILFQALPLAAREAPEILDPQAAAARNPLEGHTVALELPALRIELGAMAATAAYDGPAYVLVDGRRAVRVTLPGATVALPRRRWGPRDWLVAGAAAVGAGVLGAGLGYVAGALR